jgi:hypothetical protein
VVTGGVGVQSDQHPALTWRAAENGSGYVVRILPVREDGPSYYRTVQGVGTSHRAVDELPDGDYRVYVTENRDGVRTRTGDGHLLQIRSETVDVCQLRWPGGDACDRSTQLYLGKSRWRCGGLSDSRDSGGIRDAVL